MNVLVYEPDIPGNLGNIVRTACAYSVGSLCIYDPRGITMLTHHREFRPRIIAVSQGGWYKVHPIIIHEEGKIAEFLAEYSGRKIATVCNFPRAESLYELVCQEDDLVMLGNEKGGLPSRVIAMANIRVTIPISMRMHSLNVSTAFGIIAYEYRRQAFLRGKSGKAGD